MKEERWAQLKHIVIEQGGLIQQDDAYYLHAMFASVIFSYVDDFELCRNIDHHLIHLHSASWMGRSDFGVNRKRVKQLIHHLKHNAEFLDLKLQKFTAYKNGCSETHAQGNLCRQSRAASL